MSISQRITRTSPPIIVKMGKLLQRAPEGSLSLAQGQVHWSPPETALSRVGKLLRDVKISRYGPDEGNAELRGLLKSHHKLSDNESVMITQGANQAIINCLLAVTDANNAVGLMTPFYFNHHMAITQLSCRLHLIPRNEDTMHINYDRVEKAVINGKLKALIVTNPCNPTGTVASRDELQRIARICASHGCTLILDNTYADFVYDGNSRLEGLNEPNVLNVYSFSKNYGMSGWRMGYVTYNNNKFADSMLKVQDTVAICPTQIAQQAAIGAMEADSDWVKERVQGLKENRNIVRNALEKGGVEKICGGEGAIYLFAKLPNKSKEDSSKSKKQRSPKDWSLAEKLVLEHGIAIIPGSSCGMPDWIRVCYANLPKEQCVDAAKRLQEGLSAILPTF